MRRAAELNDCQPRLSSSRVRQQLSHQLHHVPRKLRVPVDADDGAQQVAPQSECIRRRVNCQGLRGNVRSDLHGAVGVEGSVRHLLRAEGPAAPVGNLQPKTGML